ncbi:Serpentine receptor class delta-25 [Caenorhabditis elegans]|uniref:Serpentine receptor class delta-25 n=1 Tax=Caenorhabditis elegans TaxID=6239 RepID=SRD25_CAEEL|nr:Serpentine receptor class delta-25 [Caenorhabditis elegans]P91210.1 RecName: Full=Serpentine receptor class delta-25; Short=Protein srd-25 [Caenorhabditis elegans]CCD64293.1 Serpentine receptor class delta-25 [Caenorhabditis elegans]|eukprot:NP_504973.1 Serpentine receptor class delta-25 [Caenorhabditis elegans]
MFYQLLHSVLSLVGILSNAFMMYLALKKSPKIMRSYSVVITIKTGTDILASSMSFFVMQRIITDGSSIVVNPTGPCTSFGKSACYAGHMFMLCFLEYDLVWLITSYLFRYTILRGRELCIKKLVRIAFYVFIPSMVHMGVWISIYILTESESVLKGFGIETDDMILSGEIIYWSSITLLTQLFITACLAVVAYTFIRKSLSKFARKMSVIKTNEKNLRNRLVKVATFKLILPSFIFLGITVFVAMFTRLLDYQYGQYIVSVCFMFSPVCSPYAYIIFVPHYRKFIFGRKENVPKLEQGQCETPESPRNTPNLPYIYYI